MSQDALQLPVHEQNSQLWVNARLLHAALKSGQMFTTWISRRLSEIDALEGEDFLILLAESTGGRPAREYLLTLDTGKEVAMLERNEIGRQIRRYFIEAEKNHRAKKITLPDFTNPAAAARAWADEVEAKYLERVAKEQAQQQLALAAPKAKQFDALMSTDGTYSVCDAAKLLGTGEIRLFQLLRQRSILQDKVRSGVEHHNVPYQRYLDAGYFTVITRAREDGKRPTYTTRVTPKGLAWLQQGLSSLAKPLINA